MVVVQFPRPRETAIVDVAQMEEIWIDRGSAEAGRIIGAALDDLAHSLACIGMSYRDARLDGIRTEAHAAAEIANRIGLDRLGRVARTVALLSSGRDVAALAANVDRLLRLGDGALAKVWDLQDRQV